MAKNKKIEVKGVSITVQQKNEQDFISLTDIAHGIDSEAGGALIEKWLRNKNTIEFLAVWEKMYNPNFNSTEYEGIRAEAGSNRFVMSVKQWIEKTHSIGIAATAGRYGGTYAHKEIAIEFCSWLSPEFRLYLVMEFDRLKREENREWQVGRLLSKVNYKIHTEAIKNVIIPDLNIPRDRQAFVYADEADLLNLAIFGITSKEWKIANPDAVEKGFNIRDVASISQLIVLSNLESYNSIMIKKGISKEERFKELEKIAEENLRTLQSLAIDTDKEKSPNLKLLGE